MPRRNVTAFRRLVPAQQRKVDEFCERLADKNRLRRFALTLLLYDSAIDVGIDGKCFDIARTVFADFGDAKLAAQLSILQLHNIAGLKCEPARRQCKTRAFACGPRLKQPGFRHAVCLIGGKHDRQIGLADTPTGANQPPRLCDCLLIIADAR